MRCLFCKRDTSGSRSIEHIIPESLGNTAHTLPAGVVCDACNNYFAREVEKPFLAGFPMANLRFEQGLPNKRGRVPSIPAVLSPGMVSVVLTQTPYPDHSLTVVVPETAKDQVLKSKTGRLVFPMSGDRVPHDPIRSRFLAKVALEAMAARVECAADRLDYLVSETQLDPLRHHARGHGAIVEWPTSIRRIYAADELHSGIDGQYQVLHEWDILKTDRDEWFFVLAVFGLELAINYGAPEIEGYERWLSQHGGASPLYVGNNRESG